MLSRHWFQARASERGNALIEAALLLPLLVCLLLGAADFGRLFYKAMAVTYAARAGVQYGAQSVSKSSDISGMQGASSGAASDITGFSPGTPTKMCTCWNGSAESAPTVCSTLVCGSTVRIYVTVTGTARFTTLVSWPGIPHTVTITRAARMRAQ